jgi:hypothetical protein
MNSLSLLDKKAAQGSAFQVAMTYTDQRVSVR